MFSVESLSEVPLDHAASVCEVRRGTTRSVTRAKNRNETRETTLDDLCGSIRGPS